MSNERGYTVKIRGAVGAGLIAREFDCPDCGIFDETIKRSEDGEGVFVPCQLCGQPSERIASAVLGRIKLGEVTRGKVEKAPTPGHCDTEPLADGMSFTEWKKQRRKMWDDKRRAEFKAKI